MKDTPMHFSKVDGEWSTQLGAHEDALRIVPSQLKGWGQPYGRLTLLGSRLGRQRDANSVVVAAAIEMTGQAVAMHYSIDREPGYSLQARTLAGDLLLSHGIAKLYGQPPDLMEKVLNTIERMLHTEMQTRQQRYDFTLSRETYFDRLWHSLPLMEGLSLSVGGRLSGMSIAEQEALMCCGIQLGVIRILSREIEAFKRGVWLQGYCLSGYPGLLILLYLERIKTFKDAFSELAKSGFIENSRAFEKILTGIRTMGIVQEAENIRSRYRTMALSSLIGFTPCPALDRVKGMIVKTSKETSL